jgi:hypothetical protein
MRGAVTSRTALAAWTMALLRQSVRTAQAAFDAQADQID